MDQLCSRSGITVKTKEPGEIYALLPEQGCAMKQVDKRLILTALGEQAS